jgi:L-asparaginase / beta-aspartyl-peptidase
MPFVPRRAIVRKPISRRAAHSTIGGVVIVVVASHYAREGKPMSEIIVVASSNGRVGIGDAMEVLRRGGSAVDAVEAGILPVESNPDDHSVGYAGLPNLLGEVELDASIMDGKTLAAGAVGAVHNYEHVITLARKVMDELPHVLLVGPGAERFAAEMGMEQRDLMTEETHQQWRAWLEEEFPPEQVGSIRFQTQVREWVKRMVNPEKNTGTVNFIARDRNGDIATGVSTSGWQWKYPGRLGDSPIIAAGNYADTRYGAAACQGRGEMAIRCATARSVVLYLKMGMRLESALAEAMRDLNDLEDDYFGSMNIVAMDATGRPAAIANHPNATFVYQTTAMETYTEQPRMVLVPTRSTFDYGF